MSRSASDGVVLLEGNCQRRSRIPALVRAVAGVEGVVRVENRLGHGHKLDDASSLPLTLSGWPRQVAAGPVDQALLGLDVLTCQ